MEEGALVLIYRHSTKLTLLADPSLRNNAILLTGSPIANLPTSNIFAYSTHFDAKPIGLEWIDDTTCILVFESKALAVAAHLRLQKLDEVDMDGFLTAQPIPMAIWPPELRINEGLGKGEGLRGVVRMRWARKDDVKEKGARNKSQFYKKHGNVGGSEVPTQKRRRGDGESEETLKARLDNDLDAFLAQDDEEAAPASPPSKMRSDNMDSTGQSLVDRTSIVRVRPPRHQSSRHDRNSEGATRRGKGRREPRAPARQTKSQQELDDELDAFLNEKE